MNIFQKCIVPVKGTGIVSNLKCWMKQLYLCRCHVPDFFLEFCDVDHGSNNTKPLKNLSIIWGKFKDLWENWIDYFEYKFIFYTLPKVILKMTLWLPVRKKKYVFPLHNHLIKKLSHAPKWRVKNEDLECIENTLKSTAEKCRTS